MFELIMDGLVSLFFSFILLVDFGCSSLTDVFLITLHWFAICSSVVFVLFYSLGSEL